MAIPFSGDVPKEVTRIQTGFWSFDRAMRDHNNMRGIPVPSMIEAYGHPGLGKSNFIYSIAARISGDKTVSIADLEGMNPAYLQEILTNIKYKGNIEFVSGDSDEKIVDKLNTVLSREDVAVGILDSVGAISPIGEREGDTGEANMGKRAKIMAVFSRKVLYTLRMKKLPSVLFLINHVSQVMGGMGTTTPGGQTEKYLSAVRIHLYQEEKFDDGSYVIRGKIEKNRYGFSNTPYTNFKACYLSGWGFHEGLSYVFDCEMLKLAKREKTVKLNGNSYGYISKLFAAAKAGDTAIFEPFKQALLDFDKDSLKEDIVIEDKKGDES